MTNEHIFWPTWPPPGQNDVAVFLHEGGAILPDPPTSAQPADSLVNDPGAYTFEDAKTDLFAISPLAANVPKDTIVYESADLTADVLLVGEPSVELYVEGTGSRYQVNAHLLDNSDTEDPLLLAYGTAMLDSSPAVANITMSVTGRRIPAGNRIRLEITNRDSHVLTDGGQLRYIPFFELSTTSVFHDSVRPSTLILPLIDATAATFSPIADGLSIGVRPGGLTIPPTFAFTIPPGDPDWKTSATRFKWRAKTAPHPQGLSSVTVGTSGSVFKMKAKARDVDATPITGLSSIEVSLTIGDDVWTGPVPPCVVSGSGSTLKCK